LATTKLYAIHAPQLPSTITKGIGLSGPRLPLRRAAYFKNRDEAEKMRSGFKISIREVAVSVHLRLVGCNLKLNSYITKKQEANRINRRAKGRLSCSLHRAQRLQRVRRFQKK
jgi:hypothetical protein